MLDDAWPLIHPGLLKVTEHSFDEDLPEQIRLAVLAGVAHLFVSFESDRYVGFCVLKGEHNLTGRRNLHIWASYSSGAPLDSNLGEIEAMAREQGFSQITFSSPRKGWARRMKDFQPTYLTYRKLL